MDDPQQPQPPPSLNRVSSSLGLGLAMPSAGYATMVSSATTSTATSQHQMQLSVNSSTSTSTTGGFYSPLDAQEIIENARRALNDAGGATCSVPQGATQRRWMIAPPNEDILWMPQHRPLVGGGAAAAFEALRHDYYVQKREEALKTQRDGTEQQGQQSGEPSTPVLAQPTLVNTQQNTELLQLEYVNLMNEIQNTRLMMNLCQQQVLQQNSATVSGSAAESTMRMLMIQQQQQQQSLQILTHEIRQTLRQQQQQDDAVENLSRLPQQGQQKQIGAKPAPLLGNEDFEEENDDDDDTEDDDDQHHHHNSESDSDVDCDGDNDSRGRPYFGETYVAGIKRKIARYDSDDSDSAANGEKKESTATPPKKRHRTHDGAQDPNECKIIQSATKRRQMTENCDDDVDGDGKSKISFGKHCHQYASANNEVPDHGEQEEDNDDDDDDDHYLDSDTDKEFE